jgi:hypothetical protein
MSQESEAKRPKEITIPLEWGETTEIPTLYANHLYITHSGGEFYLVFGELAPVNIDQENPPDTLVIKPLVKIALIPENMLKFAEVIKKNVDNFKKSFINQPSDEKAAS